MGKPHRGPAQVLLELLDKVPDAGTLEILIEPEHLLTLLRAHGWSDADIHRDLTRGGRMPGDLLLAVLAKQPDPAVLLSLLGNPAPRPRASPAPTHGARPAASTRLRAARPTLMILFGLALAGSSGWFLFVRLEFLRAPGLIVHFPRAYALLFVALIGGLAMIGAGIRAMIRARAPSPAR